MLSEKEAESKKNIEQIIKLGKKGLQLASQLPALALVLTNIVGRAGQLETLTRTALIGNAKADHIYGQNNILLDIRKKVGALEARLDGRATRVSGPVSASLPTWSSIVKGDYLPAKVEVRMEEREGAEKETSEERLRKIRKAIPDAKAIIPHLRATNKVSVIRQEKEMVSPSKG
ncbi:hypothetical protein GQ43DRAFT_429218 [Delitschia confertaspora ATCC 74209]|uniref:Uncharacterized protein n=1 Tax=Delitschia confertaspora ATCC 74209 TaxID=1513339 RepID=A0A9P4MUX8_9PLEO|nr:hypothetical protein GQ43DRAFT_429218 [Delitschia confertaspora ATCC 74209]